MRYFAVYKPFQMLSQFSKEGDKKALCDLDFNFPKDVYPVGRLDFDSEGLLVLTNDKRVNQMLLNPNRSKNKVYWVQTEGEFDISAQEKLNKGGIEISHKGKKHKCSPAVCNLIKEPTLPERNPPIRFRKNVATSWISLQLTEGKNRQVRKMTAEVGFPTLRLVRYSIENYSIEKMNPGEVVEFSKDEFCEMFKLNLI